MCCPLRTFESRFGIALVTSGLFESDHKVVPYPM